MSKPIVRWHASEWGAMHSAHMPDTKGDLRLTVILNEADGGWDAVVERASDGAIMATEPSFAEVEDAKAWAVYEPWKIGLVE